MIVNFHAKRFFDGLFDALNLGSQNSIISSISLSEPSCKSLNGHVAYQNKIFRKKMKKCLFAELVFTNQACI